MIQENAYYDERYIGDHVIEMKVAFYNETYREEYNDWFTLTIEEPYVEPVIPVWVPPTP